MRDFVDRQDRGNCRVRGSRAAPNLISQFPVNQVVGVSSAIRLMGEIYPGMPEPSRDGDE